MKRDPKRDPRKWGVFKNPYIYWWARQDSNLQPDRYERPALTIELQARRQAAGKGSAASGAALVYSLARDPAMVRTWVRMLPPDRYSTDTPANATTLRHRSVSAAIRAP